MIDHRYVRAWQCGVALADILPSPYGVPVFPEDTDYDYGDVDICTERGLVYVATRGTAWHTDHRQVFFLVCVCGGGRLLVARHNRDRVPRSAYDAIPVRRGTIIQLWGAVYHKMEAYPHATFVQILGGNLPVFKSQTELENAFIDHIRKPTFSTGHIA